MTLKEMTEVMLHFDNGGEVEWRYRNHITWHPFKKGFPWNFESYDYRIAKTKPISIPITEEEKRKLTYLYVKYKKTGSVDAISAEYTLNNKHRYYFLNPKTQCWEEWSEGLERELLK